MRLEVRVRTEFVRRIPRRTILYAYLYSLSPPPATTATGSGRTFNQIIFSPSFVRRIPRQKILLSYYYALHPPAPLLYKTQQWPHLKYPTFRIGRIKNKALRLYPANVVPNVTVPNVVGYQLSVAQTSLASAGLGTGSITSISSAQPPNQVLAQSPLQGTLVFAGSLVNLTVAAGLSVLVPNVVGDTLAVATTVLATVGLTPSPVNYQISTTVPAGQVISQSPAAGTTYNGTTVALVISQGAGASTYLWSADGNYQITADGFPGWSADGYEPTPLAVAQAALGANQIQVGTLTYQYSVNGTPIGYVVTGWPAQLGLPAGSVLNLIISNGPAPPVAPLIVPNVVGMYYYDAQLALLEAGIRTAPPNIVIAPGVNPGYVTAQSLVAGTPVTGQPQCIITVSGFINQLQGGAQVPVL